MFVLKYQFDTMIRMSVVVLFFIGISYANNCFDRANYCNIYDKDHNKMSITHYHCIIKCANILSKATMDFALDNMQDKLNHQCIFIENLDYCVQKWKQDDNMDCEGQIKNMVKQNFQVSNI